MLLKDFLETKFISKNFNYHEKRDFFCFFYDVSKEEYEFQMNNEIDEYVVKKLFKKWLNSYPIAYIAGYKYFYERKFFLNKNVLIPRNETEQLVEIALEEIKGINPNILDIGCGSGCIGLTLASEIKKSKVTLVDISKKALEVTEINNNKFKLKNTFIYSSNYLDDVQGKFDVIISNPPYIAIDDKKIDKNVKKYEPKIALFERNNGLNAYIRILSVCKSYLNPNGIIIFEIGYNTWYELKKLIKEFLPNANATLLKDYDGNDRFVIIKT